jgi:hypothetical protein
MKIIQSQGGKRQATLTAVEITPNGESVIIGGTQRAGQVLRPRRHRDGARRRQACAPPLPIRKGQRTAVIEVDLGDYLVTRNLPTRHPRGRTRGRVARRSSPTFQPTRSPRRWWCRRSRRATNPRQSFASPQAMLDKIMGALAFDPMTFVKAHGTDQLAILKRVVKLDTSDLDQTIHDLEAKRTEACAVSRRTPQARTRGHNAIRGCAD